MRILLVEDDRRLNQSLKMSLVEEGYAVDAAFDGEEGEAFTETAPYDAIILDVMLPLKDGLAVCRTLRLRRINTPILLLTARDAVEDRVCGLDSGADDYLVKPFALHELLARLRALLRRTAAQKTGLLTLGDLTVNPATHDVERGGEHIKLNAKEFALQAYCPAISASDHYYAAGEPAYDSPGQRFASAGALIVGKLSFSAR